MDHPSASFFRPNSFVQRSICQDAPLNFVLRLTGKKNSLSTFTTIQRQHRRGVPGSAPLKELWRYVQMEKKMDRRLEKQEYEQMFLAWAREFLKKDPAEVLKGGYSIEGTIRGPHTQWHSSHQLWARTIGKTWQSESTAQPIAV